MDYCKYEVVNSSKWGTERILKVKNISWFNIKPSNLKIHGFQDLFW